MSDKVKTKMMHQGTGYNLWARIVDSTLTTNKLAKKDPLLMQKYFLFSWDPDASTQLASNNGACGTITNVQSNEYPQAAHMIRKFLLPNPLAPSFPQAMAAPSIFSSSYLGS
jgi:hypothetical protein